MAATDSIPNPIKGQAFRLYGFTLNSITGKVITGGLTGLAATISKDGASFASVTNAPVEIGTTGAWSLDLTATECDADTIQVIVSATNANARDAAFVVAMNDLSLLTTNAWNQSVKRLEQFLIQTHGVATVKIENDGTTLVLSLPVGAGTWLSGGVDNGPLAVRETLD
jgi:hypothetical protein